jgi:hypothetical protein
VLVLLNAQPLWTSSLESARPLVFATLQYFQNVSADLPKPSDRMGCTVASAPDMEPETPTTSIMVVS